MTTFANCRGESFDRGDKVAALVWDSQAMTLRPVTGAVNHVHDRRTCEVTDFTGKVHTVDREKMRHAS